MLVSDGNKQNTRTKKIFIGIITAVVIWFMLPYIMFCDILVDVSGGGGWIKAPFDEYYLVSSATGFKRLILASQPPQRFLTHDNQTYSEKVWSSYKETQKEYSPIIKEIDPLLLNSCMAKVNEYVYYVRENDLDYFYKFNIDTNEIIPIPYLRHLFFTAFNVNSAQSISYFRSIALIDYYDGLANRMMEHISTNNIALLLLTMSDINGRVFFVSHHYAYKEGTFTSEDIYYHKNYDIYEFYPDDGTAKFIAQVKSRSKYPQVVGVR